MTTVVLGENFILADRTHAVGADIHKAPKMFDFEMDGVRWVVAMVGEIAYSEICRAVMMIPDYINCPDQRSNMGVPPGTYYAARLEADASPERFIVNVFPGTVGGSVKAPLLDYVGMGSGWPFAQAALRLGIEPEDVIPHVSVMDPFTSEEFDIVEFGDGSCI